MTEDYLTNVKADGEEDSVEKRPGAMFRWCGRVTGSGLRAPADKQRTAASARPASRPNPAPPSPRVISRRVKGHTVAGRKSNVERRQKAPLWAYLACALGLFIYQTLDAIDGKQARRTNSSSPLGELFDHGCDSLSTVFVVLGICIAVQLGTNPDWMFFCCFAGVFMFYCAHWQTYVSGTLRFGIFDVTEAQLCVVVAQVVTVIVGPSLWNIPIPVLEIQVKIVPALFVVAGAIFSCTNYFTVIFTGGVGKNGSTIAGTSVLSPFLHIGAVITLALMIYKKSTSRLFENNPCLYILAFGFVSAKITNKLVVAHMTKSEMHLQDTAFIGPGLLFLDQYFNSFINEYLVLWIALVWSLIDLIRYSVGVCNQIASHLHINIFKISSLSSPVNSQEQNHHK
ncbi:choline/ethanolaminephosphotransferase 1-like [Heptranchias perlo]|uniref:choline/ethanolaminephosphotransferase 1-like n=1 Tax=Heptranchias perlo TaxID=212740 RepID=UPI0035599EE7